MEQSPESPVVKVLEPQKTSWVALGGLIVVLLVVAGGAYYLSSTMPSTESIEAQVEALETQGDSTEPEAIEADLAAQSPEKFEEDFDAAFAELDASLAE
ncbi:MAG: hypothetical protein Q8S35_03555 [bacterium]|nr:hypothetical protein [bacterium]